MFGLGMQELIIVGIVAVLLFGRKLPEVAKSLGSSYREFKRGIGDIHSQMDISDTYSSYRAKTYSPRKSYDDLDDYEEATAPKFEPPPSEPKVDSK